MDSVKLQRDAYTQLVNLITWIAAMPKGLVMGNRFWERICDHQSELLEDADTEDGRYDLMSPVYEDGQLWVTVYDNETEKEFDLIVQPVDL